jgi:hypothetical protein
MPGSLALILGVLAIILIIIQDVVIAYHLSYRTLITILGAVTGPFVAGVPLYPHMSWAISSEGW